MKKLLLYLGIFLITGTGLAQPVYKDVASIFYSKCTSCHNQYGHSPVWFLNYSLIVSDTSNIVSKLTDNIMPPWSPDTTYSRFAHERIITVAEKNAILNWIAGGGLKGDTTLAPPTPTYSKYQLKGTPDLELKIPTFTSNASANDSYVCFSIPSGLTQNRIVKAYEIIPGNPSIVHHVIINVDTIGNTTSDLSGGCYTTPGSFSLGGYAPGAPPTVFPSSAPLKIGITIKSGSKIVLQIHYPAGTAGQIDSTKIRLYFYPVGATGVRPVFVSTPLQNWSLNIPAGTVKTYTAQYPASGTMPYPISMFATFPHSHMLATSIVNYAYLATDTVKLIRINNWDFNWQGYYTYKKMPKVPAGYKLYSKHVFDNTTNNPNNPSSPPVNVIAGTSTADEMLFDSYQWLVYQTGDEKINIDSILSKDPLITGINEPELSVNNFTTYAYPNPFENNVSIGYNLDSPAKVSIEVYSIVGTCVKTIQNGWETSGVHEIIWDGKNNEGAKLASGTYIYVVRTEDKQSYGKLSLISSNN